MSVKLPSMRLSQRLNPRLVVEIANLANLPLRVYVNEGIGQILFFESDEDCAVSYQDRGGKYQGQTGLTFAKV